MKKVIIIGSAYPLRGGGIASYNERLCYEFQQQGFDAEIFTFSLQYPRFLFPGTTQYSQEEKCQYDINIRVCINSINPLNWIRVGLSLKKIKPDLIIVRYWMPFLSPCLGTILRIAKRNKYSKIICIADNIIPHEKRLGDTMLTKYFVASVEKFVVMSEQVKKDLTHIFHKSALKLHHPLYDNFGSPIEKSAAKAYLHIDQSVPIILFFGFIREYKGLDLLIKAMANPAIRNTKIKLLIAGEFYGNAHVYLDLIERLQLKDHILLHTHFIADTEIKYYLSCADFVIQPYKTATQSGVTPLAYHFEKPMLVTNVGALPDMILQDKTGLVCAPNEDDIAGHILKLYELGAKDFIANIQKEKVKYAWSTLAKSIAKEAGV